MKTLGLAAAAGVAAVVGLGFLQTKVEFLRTNWYATPLVLAGGGLLLAKRMPTIAIALVAGAGIFGYMGWMAKQQAAPAASAGFGAYGFEAGSYGRMVRQDSGLFERNANAGLLSAGTLQGALAGSRTNAAGALQGAGVQAAMRSRGAAGLHD